MNNCPKCSKEISDSVLFCPNCGFNLSTPPKKKSKIWIILLAALIVIIILAAVLIYLYLYNQNFSYTLLSDSVEAGTTLDINQIIECKNQEAIINFDENSFDTSTLGEFKLSFSISYKNKEKNHEININVVDTEAPSIEGPKELYVLKGGKADWSQYSVKDFEKLDDAISFPEIDTSSEHNENALLTVKDSSGNEGKKLVKVIVSYPTDEEDAALAAMEYANLSKVSSAYVWSSSDSVYFVKVNDDYVCVGEDYAADLSLMCAYLGKSYFTTINMLETVADEMDVDRLNAFKSINYKSPNDRLDL